MNNKEQLIEILTQRYRQYDGIYNTNSFTSEARYKYYNFDEIKSLADEDKDKIIQLYQSKTTEPMNLNNRLLLLDCVYETISENKKYQELYDKLIDIYKIELDDKLTKPIERYDDFNFIKTNELHQAPYTTMPEYSLILADMCTKYIYEQQKSYVENSVLPSTKVESRISAYETIKDDFIKNGKQMPETQEKIIQEAKSMVTKANEERNANIKIEQEKKEIELINLQQEINKMENERLEIEKRLRTISFETIGSYYVKQVSERYPEEYQRFQQHEDQVKNRSRNQITIFDIKEKFNKVSEELQFYRGVLPVYEDFYQKFEEMKKEYHQQRNMNNQKPKSINPSSANSIQQTVQQPNKSDTQVVESKQKSFVDNLTNDVKQRIIQYMENMDTRVDVKIAGIDNVYQEGNYIVVEAKQDNGRFIGAEFTPEDFSRLFVFVGNFNSNDLSQPIQQTSKPIESVNAVSQNNVSNNMQSEEKERLINDIIDAMINMGEFHNSGLDINQKMKDIEYAKSKLASKSIEELEMALSLYAPQQEEVNSTGGMHM